MINTLNFPLSAKLIASNELFTPMHQTIMTKIKNYANGDWVIIEIIVKHNIKIFEC